MGSPATGWEPVVTCRAGGTLFLETQGRGLGTWKLAHLFSREKDTVSPIPAPGRLFSPPLDPSSWLQQREKPPDDPSLKARITAPLLLGAENAGESVS